jgi:hypothetical protein
MMEERLPVALEERYYLRNFEALCDTVQSQYEDLLHAEELEFLRHFRELSETARCLFVRLVSRVGPLFRPEKLSYPELGPLTETLAELLDSGLLVPEPAPALEELFRLCRKDEILQIFSAHLENCRGLRKDQLLQKLQEQQLDQKDCATLWQQWSGHTLVAPRDRQTVELLQLLFFGNRRQSLTDFVLSDLGVARYYPYELDRSYRLFENREQIEEYLHLRELREIYDEALVSGSPGQVLDLVQYLGERDCQPLLDQRWDRLRNRVARQLERFGEHEAALQLYRCSGSHPARDREVRILQARGELDAALACCLEIQSMPWCEEELDFVQRQIPALHKKLGLSHVSTARIAYPEERLQLPVGDTSVELAAARHYLKDWPQVHFVENSLINTLLGLALWEEIFLPLPGAFVNPYQSAPLDMHTPDFYPRRRRAIDNRLAALAGADLGTELLDRYLRYQGFSNHWVNWRYVDRDMVAAALDVIPSAHLLAMWRRILFDPKANRSGFPDLLALDPDRGYCMIEVKGPGDQLQHNQKRWLRFFLAEGIPCKVAWVSWQDA